MTTPDTLTAMAHTPLPDPGGISPRAARILLALTALPAAGYGVHKAYQHFMPEEGDEAEKQAAYAVLARYGLTEKVALSPVARDALVGAGVGGTLSGLGTYAFNRDDPEVLSRSLKATALGAGAGALAGGFSAHIRAKPSEPTPRLAPLPPSPAKPDTSAQLDSAADKLVEERLGPSIRAATEKMRAENHAAAQAAATASRARAAEEAAHRAKVYQHHMAVSHVPFADNLHAQTFTDARALGMDADKALSMARDAVIKKYPVGIPASIFNMSEDEFYAKLVDRSHVWEF